MNKKAIRPILLFTALLLSVCALFGCGYPRIKDERAMPIQYVIDAMIENDLASYKAAFPPDYTETIKEDFEISVTPDFNKYMKEFLKKASDTLSENFGGKVKLGFEVKEVRPLNDEEIKKYFDNYSDYNAIFYHPDINKVQEHYMISGTIKCKGKEKEEERSASFPVIKQDGKYYLHPVSFFYSFN